MRPGRDLDHGRMLTTRHPARPGARPGQASGSWSTPGSSPATRPHGAGGPGRDGGRRTSDAEHPRPRGGARRSWPQRDALRGLQVTPRHPGGRVPGADRAGVPGMKTLSALSRAQWPSFWRDKQNGFSVLAFPLMFLVLFGTLFSDAGTGRSSARGGRRTSPDRGAPAGRRRAVRRGFEVTDDDDPMQRSRRSRAGDLERRWRRTARNWCCTTPRRTRWSRPPCGASFAASCRRSTRPLAQEPPPTRPGGSGRGRLAGADRVPRPGLLGWRWPWGRPSTPRMPLVTWRTISCCDGCGSRRCGPGAGRLAGGGLRGLALIQVALFLVCRGDVLRSGADRRRWLSVPLAVSGTLAFMAIGMVAGAVSRTAEAASGLANVIVLPMAFLSGSFIPLEQAPELADDGLRAAAAGLPERRDARRDGAR